LRRAAEMGYAPAQARLASTVEGAEKFRWAELAAAQRDRFGILMLGHCFFDGDGCAPDRAKAIELYRQAAEMEHPLGQLSYGEEAFGELDWERYYWLIRAAVRRYGSICHAVERLLPSFERGGNGRILHYGTMDQERSQGGNQQIIWRVQVRHGDRYVAANA
jgi:TPR repeat protein